MFLRASKLLYCRYQCGLVCVPAATVSGTSSSVSSRSHRRESRYSHAGASSIVRFSSKQQSLDTSTQGFQGDAVDDPQFRLWLENCQRWGLGDCAQKAKDVREGRKTLQELLDEQQESMKSIAQHYSSEPGAKHSVLSVRSVSPQGVQGEDCERYELWVKNCQQFGFGDCNKQLADVEEGKKSLSQIFREQDELIRLAAEKWRAQNSGDTITAEKSLSQKDRLKRAVKDYGSTVIVFHVAISLMSLGGFYALVSSGVDMVAILTKLGVGESVLDSKAVTGASTFVVAYAVHKVFAPVRIAITLTCVPFIVRAMRRGRLLRGAVKSS